MASRTSLSHQSDELLRSDLHRYVRSPFLTPTATDAIIGLVSDFAKNRLALPRSYFLVLVSFFFFISQVAAANVADIRNLYIASALLGLAHGSVFSLFPTVCIEWFGLRE